MADQVKEYRLKFSEKQLGELLNCISSWGMAISANINTDCSCENCVTNMATLELISSVNNELVKQAHKHGLYQHVPTMEQAGLMKDAN